MLSIRGEGEEKALEELKNKKAPGPDSIPAELLKALGSAGKKGAIRNM